jgi:hypothetical protein
LITGLMLFTRLRGPIDRPIGAGAADQSQQSDGWDDEQQLRIETSLKHELTFHVVTIGPTCVRAHMLRFV